MKKSLIGVFLVAAVLLALSGVALADDPEGTATPFTFWEANPGNPNVPNAPQWGATLPRGASYWSYNDAYDTDDPINDKWARRKTEGSYRGYDDQSGEKYTRRSTHALDGLYDTTGNDCKTCHAVHRASGAFYLMRVDSPNDACAYCHIGDHRHAVSQAYSNGDGTIYPRNGHTIGAGKYIPDSTTYQWLADEQLNPTGDNLSGDNTTETISVRRYEANKNKIFKWSIDYEGNFVRSGPTYLTCMSCHQPHNAENLIWKPNASYTRGYMLLRANPSGSIKDPDDSGSDYMEGYLPYKGAVDAALKAPEGTLSSSNTGWEKTGYTTWKGEGANASIAIDESRLSVWCANCHNLNIGSVESVAPNWRSKSHSDRTHPVPLASPDEIDCADCHQASAEEGDFPHSGNPVSTKLLGESYRVDTGTVNQWDPVANEHLNFVCLRCHATGVDY